MRIYLSSIAPQIILDLFNIRDEADSSRKCNTPGVG